MQSFMKNITAVLFLLISTFAFSQALDPEAAFRDEVNKNTNIQQLLDLAKSTKENNYLERHIVVAQRLIALQPYNANYKFALAKAYALMDDKTSSYNLLVELQNAGLSYPIGDQEGFDNIKGTQVYDYIEEGMRNNGKPYGAGEVVGQISKHYSGMLFENIAYDSKNERFLLPSVRTGAIYELSKDKKFKEIIPAGQPQTGPWGAVDLVVDQVRDVLWVASATMPQYSGTTQENFGNSMISKYRLSTHELLNSFALKRNEQAPILFSALHLSANNSLYFVNLFNQEVFKVTKDGESIESLFALPKFKAIKAITTNKKENILYVSDYDQGVFAVDLATKKVGKIGGKAKGYYGGFDDLFYQDGDLVGIQNGVKPARLMRMMLTEDVLLSNMYPLEAAREEFKALSKGVISGEDVYYFANSQWAKMDFSGRLLPDMQWEDQLIMKTNSKHKLDDQIEYQKRMEEIKRRRGIK